MADEVWREINRLRAQVARSNGYLARQEIERLLEPLRADPKRLEPFGFKVYSQNDEDGILEEIFRRLGVAAGYFVEIGVENGLECNSLYLLHKGWDGTWIEGNINQRAAIEAKFGSLLGRKLQVAFTWITAESINGALKGLGAPADLDLLSVDIDGNDIYVLAALALRPKVVCVEYNAKFPANLSKQVTYEPRRAWTGTDYFGSSLKALSEMMIGKGYRLVGTNITGANAFFVRSELAGDLFTDDPSPEALYNPPRYWLWSDHYAGIGHPADFGPYLDLEP